MACEVFDINRSCCYTCWERRKRVDVQRMILKAKVNQVFKRSRGAAGSRTIKTMLNEAGANLKGHTLYQDCKNACPVMPEG
jgi:putative transposase